MGTEAADRSNASRGDVIQAESVDVETLARLEEFLASVRGSSRPCLLGPDDAPIELPEPLFRALSDAVAILRNGAAVSISPLHRRLSTTEAGEMLGVSRQYLTRLIDAGDLACERTGKHRRIVLSELIAYRDRRDQARLEALDRMTEEAGLSGEYD